MDNDQNIEISLCITIHSWWYKYYNTSQMIIITEISSLLKMPFKEQVTLVDQ